MRPWTSPSSSLTSLPHRTTRSRALTGPCELIRLLQLPLRLVSHHHRPALRQPPRSILMNLTLCLSSRSAAACGGRLGLRVSEKVRMQTLFDCEDVLQRVGFGVVLQEVRIVPDDLVELGRVPRVRRVEHVAAGGRVGDFTLAGVAGADAVFGVDVQAFGWDAWFACCFVGAGFIGVAFARDEVPTDAEEVAFCEFDGDWGLGLWVWGRCECKAPLEALDEAVLAARLGEKSVGLFGVLLHLHGGRRGFNAYCLFITFGKFGGDQLKICSSQEDLWSAQGFDGFDQGQSGFNLDFPR